MGDMPEQGNNSLVQELYENTMKSQWDEVVELYKKNRNFAVMAKINTSGETALHVAISIAPRSIVEKLVNVITDFSNTDLQMITDNDGNNPLHVAASTGRFGICVFLARVNMFLGHFPNNAGESPLFLAAFHGKKLVFQGLYSLCCPPNIGHDHAVFRRDDGETVLHCAVRWEYFDLAFEILQLLDPSFAPWANKQGITPLHLLATKPSVFRSGCHLGWWKNIIYHWTHVDNLQHETAFQELIDSEDKRMREHSETNDQNNHSLEQPRQNRHHRLASSSAAEYGSISYEGSQARIEAQEQRCYAKCFDILYRLYTLLLPVERIRKIKQKHIYSDTIMKRLIKWTTNVCYFSNSPTFKEDSGYYGASLIRPPINGASLTLRLDRMMDSDTDTTSKTDQKNEKTTETPLLLAARNGITEMVMLILEKYPMAIIDKMKGKNIVHLAAENKEPRVLQVLLNIPFVRGKLIYEVDNVGNNALHLAAKLKEKKPWLIPGSALQMQWEMKWYEFVKNNLPQHLCYQLNKKGQTPEEMFNHSHEDLVKQGGEWLNKTSESCSVVAALIATVAFAASTTFPGQINEKSGKPNLENQPALTSFAIASLVALCFSITALFSFLAILTSRYQKKEFYNNLPMKLLLGLTSLFVSISSMLVSFCSGHFFMLANKLKDKAFPIYAVTFLPIIFFAIAQFPLYFDIIRATFKKVPRRNYKDIFH